MSTHTQSRSIRALGILELVVSSGRPLQSADIAEMCRLPKATAHRICRLLRMEGYLQSALDGRGLIPGPRFRSLASSLLTCQAENAIRHAVLAALAQKIGETCNFVVPDGTDMVYRDRVEADWPLQVQMPIGSRIPLHCTASGKLYLGSLSVDRRRRLLRRLTLDRRTHKTITDKDALDAAAVAVYVAGVATNEEEFLEGMIGAAVPVLNASGRFIGAVSMHAPLARMTVTRALTFAEVMRHTADELAAEIAAGSAG